MALGPHDLILAGGSLASVQPLDRLEPMRRAGFAGMSLMAADFAKMAAAGITPEEFRARAAGEGIAVTEIEGIDLALPGRRPGPGMTAGFAAMLRGITADRYIPLAAAAGASAITVIDLFDGAVEIDTAAEAFAAVCDRAREFGLGVQLEYLVGGGVATYADACAIVRRAGRANGGLMIDSWHLFRSGVTLDELARTSGGDILGVQINDGLEPTGEDPLQEMMNGRLLPGEGIFDLVGMIRTLDRAGSRAPITVEVFSTSMADWSAEQIAARCATSARAILEQARSKNG
jgi:sugar phosphate isomerase/epimerase